jgi:hypothetical protein
MPRFAGKGADTGVPVTIERDRYVEGDTDATLGGILVLGEKPGSTVFPIQIDTDGYLKIYFDGDVTLQTEHEDGVMNGASKGTLTMGDDGVDLQNIAVDINGYLQAVVVNDGHLQITRVEAIFSNSVADVTLIATSTTQIVAALTTRLCTLISNKRTNTQTFRIGDSNVNASRGAELAPGESISIETNGAIYGYNPGGSESILVLLREEDDNPEPPAPPILIFPIDGAVVEDTSVTFQWESSLGATNYQIRVSTDPNVETDLFHEDVTGGATSKNYNDFPNDGTVYYWKVRAYNDVGWGSWGTIENFINGIEEEPPAAPILISPTNGFTVPGTSATFHWNSSVGATNYQIRISTDLNVEDPLFHEDVTGGATSKYYDDFPNDGTVYYWKVRAYNAVGWGSWGTIWHFTNETDDVPIIDSGHLEFYDFSPRETKFFKFSMPTTTSCSEGWQLGNTSAGGEPRTVHALVRRVVAPTVADFEFTWAMGISSHYDCGLDMWLPPKTGAEDMYWNYNTGSQAEFVEANEPIEAYWYYVMLYNDGDESVDNQRLTLQKWL